MSLDGDILQQLQRDYQEQKELILLHYWLVKQIFKKVKTTIYQTIFVSLQIFWNLGWGLFWIREFWLGYDNLLQNNLREIVIFLGPYFVYFIPPLKRFVIKLFKPLIRRFIVWWVVKMVNQL